MRTIIFILAILILSAYTTVAQQCNVLDSTFSLNGKVYTAIDNTTNESVMTLKIFPNGKILAAGIFSGLADPPNIALTSYNANGTLSGKLRLALDLGASTHFVTDIQIQSDNKILVAAYSYNDTTYYDFALLRFNKDGKPDSSFGINGKVITDVNNAYNRSPHIAIQADGKIVLAGSSGGRNANTNWTLVRYNKNGSIDTSFGNRGKVNTRINDNDQQDVQALYIQTDGKIIVTGFCDNSIPVNHGFDQVVVRYKTNGSLDQSFGTGGKVITDVLEDADDFPSDIITQNDGKILVSSSTRVDAANLRFRWSVTRYLTNGNLDSSFDGDGKSSIILDSVNNNDHPAAIAISSDNKIIIAGSSAAKFAMVRYEPNGIPDNSFACTGISVVPVGKFESGALTVALQNDGKILAAGYADNASNSDFALARYLNNNPGSLNASAISNVYLEKSSLTLYPNPAKNTSTIIFSTAKVGKYTLNVTDLTGKVVLQKGGTTNAGKNIITIDITGLMPGIYFVNLTDSEHGRKSVKLTKE